MFEELQKLDINKYKKIVSECIKQCKFLPKVSDILEINRTCNFIEKEEKIEIVECDKCKSTGYIIYKVKKENFIYEYACKCNCINGKNKKTKVPMLEEVGIME